MRRLLTLATLLALLLAGTAQADTLTQQARVLTDNLAFKRQQNDAFAYGSGARGCHHIAAHKARCTGYVLTFRNNDVPSECDFSVTIWPERVSGTVCRETK